jgi:predicted PurR-regulated permease PerM
VLLFFLAAVLVVLFFFVNQRIQKQLSFYGALVSLVCFVCVLFIGFQSKKLIEETTHGIVFQPSVTILGEPNASGTKLFTLHEGAKVELLNQEGDWQRIRFSKEKIGWVKTEVVQGI